MNNRKAICKQHKLKHLISSFKSTFSSYFWTPNWSDISTTSIQQYALKDIMPWHNFEREGNIFASRWFIQAGNAFEGWSFQVFLAGELISLFTKFVYAISAIFKRAQIEPDKTE